MGQDLEAFVDTLYQDKTGYVYSPVKEENGAWRTHFVSWPSDRNYLLNHILTTGATQDVFIAPALFKSNKAAVKSEVLGSHVVWSEVDGTPIQWSKYKIPEPTMTVQSSSPAHLHFYWLLDGFYSPPEIETLNRAITYAHDFDPSAWDCNQVLRPPETINHKKGRNNAPVVLRQISQKAYRFPEFDSIPEVVTGSDAPDPGTLPSVYEIIWRVQFSEAAKLAMSKDPSAVLDRSKHLMHLAHLFHESGLAQNQILVMIDEADKHLGKFVNRTDRMQRLNEIAYKASQKPLPLQVTIVEKNFSPTITRTVQAFMAEKFEFKLIHGTIYPGSISLLTGVPGVGKTVRTLIECLRLTQDTDKKVLFLSMEMSEPGLQTFVREALKHVEKPKLSNMFIHAPGSGVSYKEIEHIVETFKPDGIVFDSLSSLITKFEEDLVLAFLDWTRKIIGDEGFAIIIHHPRKRDDKVEPTQDDVYGSRFLTAKADVVRELIKFPNRWVMLKNRYGPLTQGTELLTPIFKDSNETHSTDSGPDGPTSGFGASM